MVGLQAQSWRAAGQSGLRGPTGEEVVEFTARRPTGHRALWFESRLVCVQYLAGAG